MLHRGTPRENLITNFLSQHLSDTVAIGTGEIIDCKSKPRENRNQHDIIIYRRNYPKLDLGGVNCFLVESVVATIEVKSLLDAKAMHQATSAAANIKRLQPNYSRHAALGWFPPKPLSFVIAYDGPSSMATVQQWETLAKKELNIASDDWNPQNRLTTAGNALDGTVVLGKGISFITNTPSFDSNLDPRIKKYRWEGERGALLFLFLAVQGACMNLESASLNTQPYLEGHVFNGMFSD
jgi:hypothetical protein